MKNHFELFGLTPAYALDLAHLDRAYRDIQAEVHPDRFAHAGDAERRASMQMTTQVNEAYRTLKSPVQRAQYLLELNGVDVGFETNTAMPPAFLHEQLEWRETLEEAVADKKVEPLGKMQKDLSLQKAVLQQKIEHQIDILKNFSGATLFVRKLMFLEKFGEEIAAAYESLEA